ncbi:MAG: lipocalin family protein [Bacteroidetes bacterium]|nr:lipocalin family protein [Bacteroidota bacterium]
MYRYIVVLMCKAMVFISSCTAPPPGVVPVNNFDIQKYQGKWYEIARSDLRFERGLSRTTAQYSLRPDGLIKVVNRGYKAANGQWTEVESKAKIQGSPTTGSLKVSFFGPFYAGYHVIALAPDYDFALVSGSSHKYLWILGRSPVLPPSVRMEFLQLAQKLGFDVNELIWVEHQE